MYLFIFLSLFLHDYLLYNSNLIQKSDHVELPGADETRSVNFILMICAWLRPNVKIINLLHILVHLKCFITNLFFLLKTNCNSFTYSTKLFFRQLYFRKKPAKNRQYSLCTTSSVSDSNDTDFKEKITL